jgi:hypothetical protein
MKLTDFKVRVPLWAKWFGEYRAWRAAVRARKAHAIRMETPVLQAVVVGKITYQGGPPGGARTHKWELMATPSGKRSITYAYCGPTWLKDCKPQEHPLSDWVREWEGGLRDVTYEKGEVHFSFPKVKS